MLPPLKTIPPEVVAVSDYEALARERMTPEAWAYLEGGAADEITVRENRTAFDRLRLRGRVLAPLAGGHTRVTLCGHTFEHPIFVAPMAYQKLAHAEGEWAMALGSAAVRAGMIGSLHASVALEDIAQVEATAPRWFQLGILPDREFTRALVRRAEAAGYQALVVTVDAAVSGVRNRQNRAGFRLPPGIEAVNLRGAKSAGLVEAKAGESAVFGGSLAATAPTWKDLEWLQALTTLPVLVKGIMSPEDAAQAVAQGAAGVIVSNHGGRTLDTLPATIEVLPGIADAVGGRVPILLDGGIRRGTDVLKALALGAQAVLVGRPCIHGLAAAGAPGVAHVLTILRAELEAAMALTGCATLAQVDRSVIWRG